MHQESGIVAVILFSIGLALLATKAKAVAYTFMAAGAVMVVAGVSG